MSRILVLPAVVLAGLPLLVGCAEDQLAACLDREAVGYEDLKAAAEQSLAGVEFTLAPLGTCADTGRPWTGAQAEVTGWPSRKIANQHLRHAGWSGNGGLLTSPDGAYRANAFTSQDGDPNTPQVVFIQFTEVADAADWPQWGGNGAD